MFLFASLGGYPKGECHAELKKTDKSLSQRVDAFHTGAKMGMPDDAPPNSGQAKIRQTALPTQTPTMVTETKRNQRIAFNAPSLSSNLVSFSRRPHPGDLGAGIGHLMIRYMTTTLMATRKQSRYHEEKAARPPNPYPPPCWPSHALSTHRTTDWATPSLVVRQSSRQLGCHVLASETRRLRV